MMQPPNRVKIGRFPTPIERLEKLSLACQGADIYVKRDDLSGMAISGNKIRKLEFLLAAAQKEKCQIVITCGAAQSNHARTTAVAAAKLGLRSHLFLRNDAGGSGTDGNLLLARLVGAEVTFVSASQYEQIDDVMLRAAEDYSKSGSRAYVIPEGGSNVLGAWGYALAMEELASQMETLGISFDHVVCAVGSGGTLAGMLLGSVLLGMKCQIHGINVCDTPEFFQNRVANILRAALPDRQDLQQLAVSQINLIGNYVGKGYGFSSQQELDFIKRIAGTEGMILDPVYTGKALLGVAEETKKGRFRKGEKLLFWHTGGIFGLFPKRALFY